VEWETLTKNDVEVTQRLDVEGGWLYRTIVVMGDEVSVSITFAPD